MASHTTETPYDRITHDGMYCIEDDLVGAKVNEFLKGGFRFKTTDGLDFCDYNVLRSKVIRDTLESVFEWCALGSYKAFGGEQHPTFSFLTYTGPEIHGVFVFLCGSGAQLGFRKGSHVKDLPKIAAPNGLLQMPDDILKKHGLEETKVDMKDGGLYDMPIQLKVSKLILIRAILDGRIGFRIIRGIAVVFGFASRKEIEDWAKMRLPKQEELVKVVERMNTTTIGTNFEFVGLIQEGERQ